MLLRRCLMIVVGTLLAGALLLATDAPGAVLLLIASILVCLAKPLLTVQGDSGGCDLLETAQRAAGPPRDDRVIRGMYVAPQASPAPRSWSRRSRSARPTDDV
jgi:hypothetical protein